MHVDADDFAIGTDELGGYLQPAAWRGTQIDDPVARIDHAKALLEFDKFVGGAGAIAVLFGFLEIAVLGMWTICRLCCLLYPIGANKKAQPNETAGLVYDEILCYFADFT